QSLIDSLQYINSSDNLVDGTRVVSLTAIRDSGGVTNGGDNEVTLSIASTVNLTAINDEPVVTATGLNPSFTENQAAVSLFASANIDLVESADLVEAVTFTVSNLVDGNSEQVIIDGQNISLVNASGTTTANSYNYTVAVVASTATVTITHASDIDVTTAQSLIDSLQYINSSDNLVTGTRVVTLTAIRDSGGVANGGDNEVALSIASTVNVTAINDEPVVTATGLNPSFNENQAAVSLFASANIDLVESGDLVEAIIFTVSNLVDGNSEQVIIDGQNISLINGSGITAANGYNYNIAVAANAATVTITHTSDIAVVAAQSLIDSLQYINNSDNLVDGTRVVTLTALRDSGGVANGGDNEVALSIASTVNVTAINDEPIVTATGLDPSFTENQAAVSLFASTAIDLVESGDLVEAITFTVSNLVDGNSEQVVIDGENINLVNGSGTTTTNSYSYSIAVVANTATVTITHTSDIAVVVAQSLIDSLQYINSSDNLVDGTRVVTLTALRDSGGVSNGGDNEVSLSIASTVNVTAINDEPIVTATALNPNFLANDPAKNVFGSAIIDLIESGDIVQAITLTVSDLQNGADELLIIDSDNIALTNGNAGTTSAGSYQYNVSVATGTATVIITHASNISVNAAETLIDGIQYRNIATTLLGQSRTITLTALQDSGGVANGGDDTASLNIDSIIQFNNIPTLTSFADAIVSTNEDTEVEITLAQLLAQGNEADIDGTVDGFVVQVLTSGTLKI
ncbi:MULTISPECIES: beta strand repeat-containing protein, partial [Cysteiniphilum]|uniref:beta strand repeat-containing protein n=1 Tax=Cysteiniphilum TaxID=2056696 RepID=UPI00177B01B5